jgi:hypothetical protein
MKRLTVLYVILLFLGTVGVSNAELFDRGGGLIYDTDLDIIWLQDANYAQTSGYDSDGLMTWYEARDWVSNLTYYDSAKDVYWDDCRLPHADRFGGWPYEGWNDTDNKLGHLFYLTLGNLGHESEEWHEPPLSGYGLTNHGPSINILANGNEIYRGWYWENNVGWDPDNAAWCFYFGFGFHGLGNPPYTPFHVWAVRDGDVVSILLPSTSSFISFLIS